MQAHRTAIISRKAKIAEDVIVGPYSVIGDEAAIGAGSKVGSHCVIEGRTTIGKKCEIFTGAVLGSRPQDLKFKGGDVSLEIGDENIIREYCTFNSGTEASGRTVVGSDNLFMAYSHIAHDCRVGSHCVIANNGTLAGHVVVEDRTVVGGLAAVHQFVRVGRFSIIGGCSKVVRDIPPYSTCDGHPARVYGLNLMGLRRNNFSRETIKGLNHAFKVIFNAGLSLKNALERIEKEARQINEVSYLVEFIKNSKRGMSRGHGSLLPDSLCGNRLEG